MRPDNYEYARKIVHKFEYSPFVLNMGENEYKVSEVVAASPATYFVHSKAIYSLPRALVLNSVTRYMRRGEICDLAPAGDASETAVAIRRMYRYARSGEYTESDVLKGACRLASARTNDEHEKFAQQVCSLAEQDSDGVQWSNKLPGKTTSGQLNSTVDLQTVTCP